MIGYEHWLLALGGGVIALFFGIRCAAMVWRADAGTAQMQAIAAAIQEGANAYLNRQYLSIAVIGLICASAIGTYLGSWMAGGFVWGAALSALAGYIGMQISVKANVRTAAIAKQGISKAFSFSVRAGAATALLVIGFGILGLGSFLLLLSEQKLSLRTVLESLTAFGCGASLISLFARLGGGIFTKGADVGADLVGKLELGIPEDDPRNPAVIADNVGDNVGDCAGMAADLFETYVVTLVAAVILFAAFLKESILSHVVLLLPLALGSVSVVSTVLGVYAIQAKNKAGLMQGVYRGVWFTLLLSAVLETLVIYAFFGVHGSIRLADFELHTFQMIVCTWAGLAVTGLLVWFTNYYTGVEYQPVRSIARASQGGHATNVIQGLAVSMESTVAPVLTIALGIVFCYELGGLAGVALAVTSMLSVAGIILTLDAYGPITDNAGGIAEMAGMDASVRSVTDAMDAIGNTTKAITKGYAIGSAGLATVILLVAFLEEAGHYFPAFKNGLTFDLSNPFVCFGLLMGSIIPFWFSGVAMQAVSRAAKTIIEEVRRQFEERKGILEGREKPDYARAVDHLTRASIKAMILPALMPIFVPLSVVVFLKQNWGVSTAILGLGSLLVGALLTGLCLALSMTAGGGAWDNAKKLIEQGYMGGKGSESHKAAITGDTVGDPYKDTAGPAINPLIKLISIVALLLLAILAKLQ